MSTVTSRIRTAGYFIPRWGIRSAIIRRLNPTDPAPELARYSYSVGLRHMVNVWQFAGAALPQVGAVMEIGPGPTLGVGLLAMLCGADSLVACDARGAVQVDRDLRVLHHLGVMLRSRSPIPGADEFPSLKPFVDSLDFPGAAVFGGRSVDEVTIESRVGEITQYLRNLTHSNKIGYHPDVPAEDIGERHEAGSVSWVLSHAVMEYVSDIDRAYRAMWQVMMPGAVMSHQIDLSSHDTSPVWDGHWRYSPFAWWVLQLARAGRLNRLPVSAHLEAMRRQGFEIVGSKPIRMVPTPTRCTELPLGFSLEDATTAGVFVVARKTA